MKVRYDVYILSGIDEVEICRVVLPAIPEMTRHLCREHFRRALSYTIPRHQLDGASIFENLPVEFLHGC